VNHSSYDEAVRRIARRPTTIRTVAPVHAQRQHAILSSRPEGLSFGELQLLLECEFDAALYYLPTALNYVEHMRQEWPQVAWMSLLVIESRQEELSTLGIYQLTVERIAEVFAAVNRVFGVRPDVKDPWAAVVGGEGRVVLIDSIFKFNMPCRDSTLFETVMGRWSCEADRWQSSATFLDLFMHMDWSPAGRLKKVFASPLVVALRRNRDLLCRHWELAGREIKRLCPPEYCDYLSNVVLQ
jgi:hypothetical protein